MSMDTFLEFDTLGEIYIIAWVVLSNIMLINLMIAVFSDTYSRLKKVGEGLYLIEIIEMSPEMKYDKYYSGLVSYPFPLNGILILFFPIYLFVKNEKFNTLVLKIGHSLSVCCVMIPASLLFAPIAVTLAYCKCLLNKFTLIFVPKNC